MHYRLSNQQQEQHQGHRLHPFNHHQHGHTAGIAQSSLWGVRRTAGSTRP